MQPRFLKREEGERREKKYAKIVETRGNTKYASKVRLNEFAAHVWEYWSEATNTGNGTRQRYRTPCCDSTWCYHASRSINFTTPATILPPLSHLFIYREFYLRQPCFLLFPFGKTRVILPMEIYPCEYQCAILSFEENRVSIKDDHGKDPCK